MNENTNETYLRDFLPRAVYSKMKCLRWYRHNDTGALSMALFVFVSNALRAALHKAGLDDERMSDRSEERRVGKECRSRWSPYH